MAGTGELLNYYFALNGYAVIETDVDVTDAVITASDVVIADAVITDVHHCCHH